MRTILLAAFLCAVPAFAADLTGRWWGEVSGNDSQPVYLIVFQDGNSLKGTGGPDPQNQSLLTNGKIQGSRVSFDVVPGNSTSLHFELTLDDAGLKGTVKFRRNGQFVTSKVSLRKRTT